jgi:hypothetical protein
VKPMKSLSKLFADKRQLAWYELSWPAELLDKDVAGWLYNLNGQSSSAQIRFRLVASTGKIRYFLGVPESSERTQVRTLQAFLPDIELKATQLPELGAQTSAKVKMTSQTRSLQIKLPELSSHGLITAMSVLAPGETITMTWYLGKRYSPKSISKNITSLNGNWLSELLRTLAFTPQPLEAELLASYRQKMKYPSWKANIFISLNADTYKRRLVLLRRVEGALRDSDAPGVRLGIVPMLFIKTKPNYKPLTWPLCLNSMELTGMLGWPLGDAPLPGITRIASKYIPIPKQLGYAGRTLALDKNTGTQLKLRTSDGLTHTHVIGPTGVGKTTLLLNLISQDIALGNGVIVVDPKGDLVDGVLSRIPENRQKDVIILDPSDYSRPVGLNPLRSGQSATLAVDNVLSVFKKLYKDNLGPRTEDILHAGLLTLSKYPGMSLSALPILFTNPVFRSNLIDKIDDPIGLGSFWNWFDNISEAERSTVLAPLMNKLRVFLLRPAMRSVLSQSSPKLDINDVLNNQKILLVNLSKGVIGSETSQLFGALVVSQIWQAIQARANLPTAQRRPSFVYIDEVQDYLHLPTDIGDFLAQSRSYGVGMVLAHQYLSQLSPELKSAVMSNIRTRISFQLGHADAVEMAATSKVLKPSDFENLERYRAYGQVALAGATQPWVSGVTLPPSPRLSNPERIKQLSRQAYGTPINQVESDFIKLIDKYSQAKESEVGSLSKKVAMS